MLSRRTNIVIDTSLYIVILLLYILLYNNSLLAIDKSIVLFICAYSSTLLFDFIKENSHFNKPKSKCFLFALSAYLFIVVISTIAIRIFFQKSTQNILVYENIIAILSVGIIYPFGIKMRVFGCQINKRSIYLTTIAVLIYVFFLFGYVIFNNLFDTPYYRSIMPIKFLIGFILNVLSETILTTAYEEIIYRGLVIYALSYVFTNDTAILILESIIFGLLHIILNPYFTTYLVGNVLFQIAIGYMLGKIYLKTKTIWPCIIIHAIYNTLIKMLPF